MILPLALGLAVVPASPALLLAPIQVSSEDVLQGAARRLRKEDQFLLWDAGPAGAQALVAELSLTELEDPPSLRRGVKLVEELRVLSGRDLGGLRVSVEPEAREANAAILRAWQDWALETTSSEGAWWAGLGLENELLRRACSALGYSPGLTRDILQLQLQVKAPLARALEEMESLEAALEERRLARILATATDSLVRALEAEEKRREEALDIAGLQDVQQAIAWIRAGNEVPWPVGWRTALSETLRSTKRDAEQDQREFLLEGGQPISVSVHDYGGCQYSVVQARRTWWDAERLCRENGGRLAWIETEEEFLFIEGILPALGSGQTSTEMSWDTSQCVWVGATDGGKEGDWRFANGVPVPTQAWLNPRSADGRPSGLQRQPNNSFETEHWAAFHCVTGLHDSWSAQAGNRDVHHRWGLSDWYGGWPSLFLCVWGKEPPTGIWACLDDEDLRAAADGYFRAVLSVEDRLNRQRKQLQRDQEKVRRAYFDEIDALRRPFVARLEERVKASIRANPTSTARLEHLRRLVLAQTSWPAPAPAPLSWGEPSLRRKDAALGHGLVQSLFGRSWALLGTSEPVTQDEAQRRCEALGGALGSFALGTEDGSAVGSGEAVRPMAPPVEAAASHPAELEVALCWELMREGRARRAWLGYGRASGYGAGTTPLGWLARGTFGEPLADWVSASLEGQPVPLGGNWAYGHYRGAYLSCWEDDLPLAVEVPLRSGQELFPNGDHELVHPYAGMTVETLRLVGLTPEDYRMHTPGLNGSGIFGFNPMGTTVKVTLQESVPSLELMLSPLGAVAADARIPYFCVLGGSQAGLRGR